MFRALVVLIASMASGMACAQLALTPQFALDVTEIVEPHLPGEGVGYAAVGFDGTDY